MKMTNVNRAVLLSIIGLCLISIIYRYIPKDSPSSNIPLKTTLYLDLLSMTPWQNENPVLHTLISKYEEENPNIAVIPVVHSRQDLVKKLFDPPAADPDLNGKKTPGDLVMIDMDLLPDLQKTGILEPPAAFPKDDPEIKIFYETSRIDGNSPVIPLFSNPYIFFYNVDILKAAGFDRPPKDREELLQYSRVLKEKQIAGIGLALSAENHSGMFSDVYSWFWSSDISFINDNKPQFLSRQVLETLSFLNTLNKEQLISPGTFIKTESMKIDEFCSGKTAMMITSLSAFPEITGRAGFEWGITSIPTAVSYIGNPRFVSETFGIGIYAQSEQKEEAWKFLTFLAGAEHNADLASSYYCLPKNPNAQTLFAKESPQMEKALTLFTIGREINEFDVHPGVFSAEKNIRSALQKMMTGEFSPALAAEEIQTQMTTLTNPSD